MLSLVPAPLQSVAFEVLADADPGLLPRVLVSFARRGLTPDQMKARRLGERMSVSLCLDAMPSEMVHLVEGNLRQVVGVCRVEVVLRAAARAAA